LEFLSKVFEPLFSEVNVMKKFSKMLATLAIAGVATFGAGSASAFFGMGDWFDGPWDGPNYGYPGYGYGGYPGYGYGGYPGGGYGGYPGYGYGGYPGSGYGGYPGYSGYGYGGYPGYGYAQPYAAPAAPAAAD